MRLVEPFEIAQKTPGNTGEWPVISFPRSIYGFDGLINYLLKPVSGVPEGLLYYHLQSLDRADARFVIRFITDEPVLRRYLDERKLFAELETLGLDKNAIDIAVIARLRAPNSSIEFNFKAPLIIDQRNLQGWQFLLF